MSVWKQEARPVARLCLIYAARGLLSLRNYAASLEEVPGDAARGAEGSARVPSSRGPLTGKKRP